MFISSLHDPSKLCLKFSLSHCEVTGLKGWPFIQSRLNDSIIALASQSWRKSKYVIAFVPSNVYALKNYLICDKKYFFGEEIVFLNLQPELLNIGKWKTTAMLRCILKNWKIILALRKTFFFDWPHTSMNVSLDQITRVKFKKMVLIRSHAAGHGSEAG